MNFFLSQVLYIKGADAAPIPGPQGPPGTPVSVAQHFSTVMSQIWPVDVMWSVVLEGQYFWIRRRPFM